MNSLKVAKAKEEEEVAKLPTVIKPTKPKPSVVNEPFQWTEGTNAAMGMAYCGVKALGKKPTGNDSK